jgi:serine phosphatase RsbU (regulator of sigma subunit)
MATLAVGAYRHARRFDAGLDELYAAMDAAVAAQFTADHFATAQMARLDVSSGLLQWVNAGHPAPLLLRGHRVLAELDSPTTLPVGFGGAQPVVTERMLERGDRVLFFTDGLIEEHREGGEQFGEARLIDLIERASRDGGSVQEMVRRLSSDLMQERGGVTTDDATLLLLEWRGGRADHLAVLEGPFSTVN